MVGLRLWVEGGKVGDWLTWGRMEYKGTSRVESICVSKCVGWDQFVMVLGRG